MCLRHFLLSFCYPGCMIQPGILHGVVKKQTWMICTEEITPKTQSRNEKAVAEDWPTVPAQLRVQSHNQFKPTEKVTSSPRCHWRQNFIPLHASTGAQGVQRQPQGGMELGGSRIPVSSGFIFSRLWPTAEQPKRLRAMGRRLPFKRQLALGWLSQVPKLIPPSASGSQVASTTPGVCRKRWPQG